MMCLDLRAFCLVGAVLAAAAFVTVGAQDSTSEGQEPFSTEVVEETGRELVQLDELPPHCADCGGILKSDTVSFGEPIPPDVLQECFEVTELCDCMIVAGTSATVYPAAQFPRTVLQRGGTLIEINPYESELTAACTISIRATACEALPGLVEKATSLRERRP